MPLVTKLVGSRSFTTKSKRGENGLSVPLLLLFTLGIDLGISKFSKKGLRVHPPSKFVPGIVLESGDTLESKPETDPVL